MTPRIRDGVRAGAQIVTMRQTHAGRQSKSGSQLARPKSQHRRVDSYAKGLAGGSLDPLDQFPGKSPIFLQIELKPQGAFASKANSSIDTVVLVLTTKRAPAVPAPRTAARRIGADNFLPKRVMLVSTGVTSRRTLFS